MKIFLVSFCVCIIAHTAVADGIVVWNPGNYSVSAFYGYRNRVMNGAVLNQFDDDIINVTESMAIENYGIINGSLIAHDDNAISIVNTGTITGQVVAAHITQLVTSGASAKRLNVDTPDFFVKVDGAMDGVRLIDIKNLGSTSVEFTGSKIIIDDFSDWQNWDAHVSWGNTANMFNTLLINDLHTIKSGDYINQVYAGTMLNILSSDADKLYRIDSEYDAFGVKLNVVRETDYQRIFDDSRGVFLSGIRNNNPNDKMLKAMDDAKNMDELQNIMNSSYRFNSSVLMRPVKSMNNFMVMDNLAENDASGIGIVPWYIGSDDVHVFGARAYVKTNYNNYLFDLGLHLNTFSYENNVNDFGGTAYGADIKIKKQMDKLAALAQVGFNIISFDADSIYDGINIINNPNGYALYAGIDGVYDYDMFDGFVLAPFVGAGVQRFDVLDFSENTVNLRSGGIIKYNFIIDSVKYEYSALLGVMTNGEVFGNAKVGFDSLADNAGLSINIGAYNESDSLDYRVSINARILF